MAKRNLMFCFFLTGLAGVTVTAMSVGRYPLDLSTLGRLVLSGAGQGSMDNNLAGPAMVLWSVRAPRILMAMMAGAALSVSGAVFQGLFKNPLVSPAILGVTSGANFGAGIGLLFFAGSAAAVQASAFAWGLAAVALTCWIAHLGARSVTTLVLAGVIVSAIFVAGLSWLKCKADPLGQLPAIVFWTMGSFSSSAWTDVAGSGLLILAGLVVSHLCSWGLNPMALGEEEALSLGIDVSGRRRLYIISATLMVSAATAPCGSIGWVGLVIPHMARMLTGADHDTLIPFSAMLGAIFMVAMDTIARTLPGGEIPVGILTAVIGAPCFALLLIHKKTTAWNG